MSTSYEILGDRALREIVETYGGTEVLGGDRGLRELIETYGGTEVLGQGRTKADWLDLGVRGASEIAQRGIAAYRAKEEGKAEATAADRAIKADEALTAALAKLYALQATGADTATLAAQQAVVDAGRAANFAQTSGLSAGASKRRADAAAARSGSAAGAWAGAPSDPAKAALAKASQEVASVAAGLPAPPSSSMATPAEAAKGAGFLATLKRPVGPLPLWMWILGGVGGLVGTYLFFFRRPRLG